MMTPECRSLRPGLAWAAALVLHGCQMAPVQVPVSVGGEAELDACAVGVVRSGDGLPVHAGPAGTFGRIDQLEAGSRVWLCERVGEWIGAIYGEGTEDCGLASPLPARQPYQGPCGSGWIEERGVELMAG